MKITIWLRTDERTGGATLRMDKKYESRDSVPVRRFGDKLFKAIESGGERTE